MSDNSITPTNYQKNKKDNEKKSNKSSWGDCEIPYDDCLRAAHNGQPFILCKNCGNPHSLWTLLPPHEIKDIEFQTLYNESFNFGIPKAPPLHIPLKSTRKTIMKLANKYFKTHKKNISTDLYADSFEKFILRAVNVMCDKLFSF